MQGAAFLVVRVAFSHGFLTAFLAASCVEPLGPSGQGNTPEMKVPKNFLPMTMRFSGVFFPAGLGGVPQYLCPHIFRTSLN